MIGIEESGKVRIRYDKLHLDSGVHAAKDVMVNIGDNLSKAPPETHIKQKDLVRVAFDAEYISGQKWQYGIVRYVHHKLLLDINLDGCVEQIRGLPAYAHEVQLI